MAETIHGHGGDLILAALRTYGVQEVFTLSGGHLFPLYDACVKTGIRPPKVTRSISRRRPG